MDEKLKCSERESKRKFVRSNHVLEISHAYIFEVTHVHSPQRALVDVLSCQVCQGLIFPTSDAAQTPTINWQRNAANGSSCR